MSGPVLNAAFLFRDRDEAQTGRLMKRVEQLGKAGWPVEGDWLSGEAIAWCWFRSLRDPCLLRAETVGPVLPLSREVPLLYFFTTDAYLCETSDGEEGDFSGWGFRILAEGEEKARVMFSYGWPSYGEGLKRELDAALAGLDRSLFRLFDLGDERERALAGLLDPEALFAWLEGDGTLEEVECAFTGLLDIQWDFLGVEFCEGE